MAKAVQITEMPELGIDAPNLFHIQESYLRQIAHSRPFTSKKKNKAEVNATSAKWYRQKGTGRARQGEQTNPHMYGGGLAFPPRPRNPIKRMNKVVRRSAQRSAVLWHVQNGSAFMIPGKEFDGILKTKEVAQVIEAVGEGGTVALVVAKDSSVWRSARNMPLVQVLGPLEVNVRDLVHNRYLVFSESGLEQFKRVLTVHTAEVEGDGAGEAAE
jgi:large subunit ribosomal protein L4